MTGWCVWQRNVLKQDGSQAGAEAAAVGNKEMGTVVEKLPALRNSGLKGYPEGKTLSLRRGSTL